MTEAVNTIDHGAHVDARAGNLGLAAKARTVIASQPDESMLRALRTEIERRITNRGLTKSRAPLLYLYKSFATWLIDSQFETPWDSLSSARVQMWEIEWFNPVLDYQKRFVSEAHKAFPAAHGFEITNRILETIPDGSYGFIDDRQKDVTVYRRADAKMTIIGFSGLKHVMVGIGWTSFDRAIASKLNANLIVLKDFHRRLYLNGIESIGDFAATTSFLRNLLQEFSGTRIVAIGGSGGVFAALNMSCKLEIKQVIAIAGPTSLKIGESSEDKQVYKRIAADAAAGLIDYPDIVELVNASEIRRVDFFVSGKHEFDYSQMRNLADGCACVVPHVYEDDKGHGHVVIDRCVTDGSLLAAFNAEV